MSDKPEEKHMLNVQVDLETNELLKALKERYEAPTMWAAIKEHLLGVLNEDEIKKARELAAIREREIKLRTKKPRGKR